MAVPDPVTILFAALLFIVVDVTAANVESPLKNVDELAVPDPNLAVGTVPDVSCVAFKAVNPDPLPVAMPVKNTSPSLLKVIPLPTTIPFLAEISQTESTFVTSSYVKTPPTVRFPENDASPTAVTIPLKNPSVALNPPPTVVTPTTRPVESLIT